MPSIAIELININKQFAPKRGETDVMAVNNINMSINDGEFFSMLGPSGCGKTTTLRMIAGFEKPTSGQILINGQDVSDIPPFHRPVNTVFQDYALFPHMTIAQNVAFGLEMAQVSRAEIKDRVAQMLDLVQLHGMDRRFPRQLSGGQQQRVALARALIKQPKVLLLDEPLGALDLKLRKQMQFELKQMQRKLGITFIYVTHDQEEALTMSDRIAVMNKGNVLQIGQPEEIYDRPTTRFVADFIGETSFLNACVREIQGNEAIVAIDDKLPLRVNLHGAEVKPDDQVQIAIRPEKVNLCSMSDTTAANCLPGIVEERIFIGTDTRFVIRLTDHTAIVVRSQNGIGSTPDQFLPTTPVKVQCLPDYALIFTK